MDVTRLTGAVSIALLIAGVLAACGSSSSEEATPLHRAENGIIAYEDDGMEVWVMNPDGSERHKLLSALDFGISPDGEKVAYAFNVLDRAIDNYVPKLWVMNADGKRKHRVPIDINAAELEAHPDWAPDKKTIVFSGGPGEDVHIYSVKPDGSDLKQLTTELDGDPDWSPDGKMIAFVRFNEQSSDIFELYVMNADGSDQHKLTGGSNPDWSPDGKKIIFDGRTGIEVINADGSDEQTLIALAAAPAWSPDGKMIAYRSGEVGEPSNGLYVMNVDGSNKRQLTHTGFSSVNAIVWQPR